MDNKPRGKSALALPLPPITSMTCWLVARHLGSGAATALGLAGLAGLLCLAAIAIMEHEETRRAALPYKAEHLLARAEARNRSRYARAQTRRINRLTGGEQYSPDTATSLTEVMHAMREPTATDRSVGPKYPGPNPARQSRPRLRHHGPRRSPARRHGTAA